MSSLLPKEHGAYGQLAFPLATSFAVAGMTMPALLTGIGAVAGFLTHEPLLVLLGRRGVRMRREQGRRAAVWLGTTGITACAAGLTALWLAPPAIRWSFGLPFVPACYLAVAIVSRNEKSALGEVAAALTFSLLAVPLCLAAGAETAMAFAVGLAFASILVSGTLAVRVVILAARGGHPRAARAIRAAALLWTTTAAVGLAITASRGLVPWLALAAASPGLAAAVSLALRPPSPMRLRAVGWTLIATSAATALILAAGRAV